MKIEEMICRFYVYGSCDKNERQKAEKIGLKAYRLCNKTFANPIFTPCYNWIWDKLFPNYTKEEYLDEDKMYTKLYFRILNAIAKIYVFLCGGYWLRSWRKVDLNYNYTIRPCTIEELNKDSRCTHIVDDMISIKRIGV